MKKNLLFFALLFSAIFANSQTFTLNPLVQCAGNSTIFAQAGITGTVAGATSYSWTFVNTYTPSNPTYYSYASATNTLHIYISYLNPGTTTVICSAYNGSTFLSSSSNTLLVNASPLFTISSSGPPSLCSGTTVTLSVTGTPNYTWLPMNVTNSSVAVTPTASTCYTVIASNGICTYTDTYCVNVATASPVLSFSPAATFSLCAGYGNVSASGAVNYTWSSPYSWNNGWAGANLPLTATGCYTVHGVNGCGSATAIACATGTVPPPTISVAAPSSVCPGSSTTLTVNVSSGPIVYTSFYWYAGSYINQISQTSVAVISPTANTCYTVVGQNQACGDQTTFCVNVLNTPTIAVSPLSQTVCEGTSANISASGASTYSWSNGTTTATTNVLPSVSSAYTVAGTDVNGCTGFDVATVIVDTTCSDVWPGDANSDGIVDNTDVFEIGLAYGNTGPTRSPGGNSYTSQYAGNWSGTVSTGKNQNHADCNGDGTINSGDTLAIFNNYSLTHSFKPGSTSANPDIYFVATQNTALDGQWSSVDIMLGETATPVNQLYGVAFDVNFDKNLIETNSAYILYSASFLNASNTNVEFRKLNFSAGKIYAASVRTNGNNVNGDGKIGEFWYKTKSNLPDNTSLNLSISNPGKIDNAGADVALTGGSIVISNISTGISKSTSLGNSFHVYPNPAKNQVSLTSSIQSPVKFSICDLVGKIVMNGEFNSSTTLNTSTLSAGSYVICIQAGAQSTYKKLVIEK